MKKIISLMMLMLAVLSVSAQSFVDDISGQDVVTFSNVIAKTEFKANTWYTMYNQGRKGYAYGNAELTKLVPLSGYSVEEGYKFLVRFVESSTEGKYYIQTPNGSYYKDLGNNSGTGTTTSKDQAGLFTIAPIGNASGYWCLKGTNFYMDSNGAVVLGYGTTAPTSTSGNSAWELKEAAITSYEDLSGGAQAAYQLLKGGLFRIQSRGNSGSQYIAENVSTKKATTATKQTTGAIMRQMWIIEHDDNGFSMRNAATGDYIQSDYSCTPTKAYWTIMLSPNNTSDEDKYMILCHGELGPDKKTCANLNGGSTGLTDWSYANDKNSEWLLNLVEASEVDTATVKANLDKICNTGSVNIEEGQYYQFISLNEGGMLTERVSDGLAVTQEADEKAWNQYWKLVKAEDGTYTIQNVYSGKYLLHKATSATSPCGGNYSTSSSSSTANRSWNIEVGTYAWETTYSLIEPLKPTTAIGSNSNSLCTNASILSTAAQWIAKRVDLTDEQVAEAQEAYSENTLLLNTSTTLLNSRLSTFFADYACTTLKDAYTAMSDEELTNAMKEQNLPLSIIRTALKIKNDTWGHREKEFRIYDYEPYSDYSKWNDTKLMGTGYQFSPQTGPTGISVKPGEIIVIYVGANAASGTTLEYSSVPGCNVYAQRQQLKRGINIFTPNDEGFLYIHHTITSTSKKLNSVNPITVHIEGGRVQGYFDITRGHTNADWKDMTETLFKDEIVHMKSKYYQYNMHYAEVLKQIKPGELDEIDTDGCPKGIEGTLRRWDDLVAVQRYIMGVDQFLDRFNCMLSASSSSTGNPYASSYGTYYPGVGTIMNYDAMTHGTKGDNGGNFWCIAHETGHVHQGLYNLAGCTEVSNNNFSQINTWIQGSNTGRGGPWSEAQSSFHKKVFWFEYDLWQRSRAYFQLWLYFHLQEHDVTFYPRLFDKFRETPMTRSANKNNPSSGTTDYLRFAKFACDVAQADLSEFFQFWGFFVPLQNYEVGDYTNTYFTTTQAEIDEAIAYMHKYPKKLGNILFIDERIKEYPANYPGMPANAKRVATTPGVNPGDPNVVGRTGMFTDFVDDVDYEDYTYTITPSTGKVVISQTKGKGAVGFKVYNADHQMVYCYNNFSFSLPADIRTKPYYIKVALGDGTDRLLYDPNDISAVESTTTAENAEFEYNPAAPAYTLDGQKVAQPTSGNIYIQNGIKFRMK